MVSLRISVIYVCLTLLTVIKAHTQEAIVKLNTEEVNTFCAEENEWGISYPAPAQELSYKVNIIPCYKRFDNITGGWYILQIDEPGDLGIKISHSNHSDLDFSCIGPFEGKNKGEAIENYHKSQASSLWYTETDLTNTLLDKMNEFGCETDDSDYTESPVVSDINDPCFRGKYDIYPDHKYVDCSSSHFSTEACYIPDAKKGEWYFIFINNLGVIEEDGVCKGNGREGTMIFQKIGGTATTQCDVIIDTYSTGPYCEGDTIRLIVQNPPKNATFLWTGPNGFTSTERCPIIPNAQPDDAGQYTLVMFSNGLETPEKTIDVKVTDRDTFIEKRSVTLNEYGFYDDGKHITRHSKIFESPTLNDEGCWDMYKLMLEVQMDVHSTGPYCKGDTIRLIADHVPEDAQFLWTGPNGFTSSERNPIVPNATHEEAGLYKLVMHYDGFDDQEKNVDVVVSQEDTFIVKKSVELTDDEAFVFEGKELRQNGIYEFPHKRESGCDSLIILDLEVQIDAYSTGPYCKGEDIELKVTHAPEDATFEWTGPNNFTSSVKAPTIFCSTTDDAGEYVVVMRDGIHKEQKRAVYVDIRETDTVFIKKSAIASKANGFIYNGQLLSEGGVYEFSQKRDKGCDTLTILDLEVLLDINPRTHFSPNNDGIEDVWRIDNIEMYPEAVVYIYDRRGKLLFQKKGYDNEGNSWDGTYKGKDCPSSDYWYVIDIESLDLQIDGHFTLIR